MNVVVMTQHLCDKLVKGLSLGGRGKGEEREGLLMQLLPAMTRSVETSFLDAKIVESSQMGDIQVKEGALWIVPLLEKIEGLNKFLQELRNASVKEAYSMN